MSMYHGQMNMHWQHPDNSSTADNGISLGRQLASIDFVSLADLTQDQRNTLASIMTHRGRTLDQHNVQEVRDLFPEMFCTTKTAVDNPMM